MRSSGLPSWSNQPVSTIGRILASTLLFLFALGFLGFVLIAINGELRALSASPASAFGILFVVPFLYSMAVKGKYPRHWLPWK
jgi:hypothetical protein